MGIVREPTAPLTRRLAAVWFADIVGYVSLSTEDEKKALRLVRIFERAAREVIEKEGGYLVKFIGDEVLAEFGSTLVGLEAGFELRRVFAERAAEMGISAKLRIGMHLGDVATSPHGDIFGEGVNVASRLTRLADPDGVLVSEDVWRQLRRRPDILFEERGFRELKGVDEPLAVYSAAAAEEAGPRARVDLRIPRGTVAATSHPSSLLRGARVAVVGSVVIVSASALYLAIAPGEAADTFRGALAFRSAASGYPSGLDLRRIAVRYFHDRSPDGRYEFLADGLTEDLIEELARTPALDVVSRNGVAGFRDAEVRRDSVARALRAGTLVEGYVEPVGDEVRVTVTLVEGESGAEFRRQPFRVPAAEIATVRYSVLQEVHRFLREYLGREVRLRELRQSASTPAAWAAYQRGERTRKDARERTLHHDAAGAAGLFARADSILMEAERLDAAWTAPVILRGEIAYQRSRLANPRAAVPWIAEGLAHVRRALDREPTNARALELRGTLRYWHWITEDVTDPSAREELLQLARADLERAVDLDPSRAGAWNVLSHLYIQRDDVQDDDRAHAVIAAHNALRADAYLEFANDIQWRLFTHNYDLADLGGARTQCNEGYRRFPSDYRFTLCRLILAASPAGAIAPEQAWDLLAELDTLAPAGDLGVFEKAKGERLVAGALARALLPDSARKVLTRAVDSTPVGLDPHGELPYFEAYVHVALGDHAAALNVMRRIAASDPHASFEHNWWWDPVRSLPGFAPLRTAD